MPSIVEVRCPVGPQRLFTKLSLGKESISYVHPENLMEVTCSDCARRLSRDTGKRMRVFHRYNFLGEFVETVAVELDESNSEG